MKYISSYLKRKRVHQFTLVRTGSLLLGQWPISRDVYTAHGAFAFTLCIHLMKPYSEKTLSLQQFEFNKRLSRARVDVENAFGILTARFGVFQKSSTVTMTCCHLHNFLAKEPQQSCFFMATAEITEYDLV